MEKAFSTGEFLVLVFQFKVIMTEPHTGKCCRNLSAAQGVLLCLSVQVTKLNKLWLVLQMNTFS